MNNELLDVIEKLNEDYINLSTSKETKIGTDVLKIKDNLKKGKILNIFKARNTRKKINNYNIHGDLDNDYNLKFNSNKRPKIAVYTCITGNYDKIYSPLIKPDNIDYFLFSDDIDSKTIGYWNIKKIPDNINNIDNILKNRYIKMHPYELFKEYDYSIYIDGNILVVSDLTDMVCSIKESGVSFHEHRYRNCIFDEIEVCRLLKKGNYKELKKQVDKYLADGFPKKFGLYECNVILCDLKNNTGKKIMNDWWYEFLNSKSYRDQISLPYVVWKNNLKYTDIGFLGKNVYRNPKIRLVKHK